MVAQHDAFPGFPPGEGPFPPGQPGTSSKGVTDTCLGRFGKVLCCGLFSTWKAVCSSEACRRLAFNQWITVAVLTDHRMFNCPHLHGR